MDREVAFAIVGTGNISRTYWTAIGRVPGARVAAFVSRQSRRPAYLPGGADVEVAPALAAVATPFDAVVLATPNGLHHEGALAAAALGKHVLTEKPLDVSRAAMDAMIDGCRAAGVQLGVAYQRRMSPDHRALYGLLADGRLGRRYAADLHVKVFRDDAYYAGAPYRGSRGVDGGGAFMMQASHHADLYAWLFGLPDEVVARTGTLGHAIEVEDHGAAVFRHADGMIGTLVASTVARPGFPPRLELHTEAGTVVLVNDVITTWAVDGLPNPSTPAAGPLHSGISAAVTDTAGHEALVADFAAAVREGREPAVTGTSGRLATELILRIYEAAGYPPVAR